MSRSPSTVSGVLATLTLVLVTTALISACGSTQNRRGALRDAVRDYAEATRWGHVAKAATFIPAKKRPEFIQRRRRAASSLRILEVDMRGVRLSADQTTARVIVAVAFTANGDPVTRHHLVDQHWRWTSSGWMLTSRKRVKAPAPGATEPADIY